MFKKRNALSSWCLPPPAKGESGPWLWPRLGHAHCCNPWGASAVLQLLSPAPQPALRNSRPDCETAHTRHDHGAWGAGPESGPLHGYRVPPGGVQEEGTVEQPQDHPLPSNHGTPASETQRPGRSGEDEQWGAVPLGEAAGRSGVLGPQKNEWGHRGIAKPRAAFRGPRPRVLLGGCDVAQSKF